MAHMESVTLEIPGKPMTWSRTAANFGKGPNAKPTMFTPTDRRNRMGLIAGLWQQLGVSRFEKDIWLGLHAEFVFDRPASHFGTGRNAGVLKERYRHARPGAGTNGGDLDNLIKLVGDSLNKIAYYDDAQIADIQGVKRYAGPGEVSHTRVTLQPLEQGAALEVASEPPQQMELVDAA